jgi:hypothetical protein
VCIVFKMFTLARMFFNSQTVEIMTVCKCFFAAGVRLRYPASYVLVTGEVDSELMKTLGISFAHSSPGAAGVTNNGADTDLPSSKPVNVVNASSPLKPPLETKLDCSLINTKVACRIVEKMWQDGTVSSGIFAPGYNTFLFGFCTLNSVMYFITYII